MTPTIQKGSTALATLFLLITLLKEVGERYKFHPKSCLALYR
jgi:hypothetical protein